MEINLKNVGKKFNNEWIFQQFNFHFKPNDYYAIIGNNGSGKSTFLKTIAGFLTPNEGEITFSIHNKPLSVDVLYKQLAYCAPYIDIFEEYTLKETYNFYTFFKPFSNKMSYKKFVKTIDLEKAENKVISEFSSGMKQRVKLALAILSDCSILLLDEPTSNLDQNAINWYQELVKKHIKNKIVFVASNEQKHDYFFCNKTININK